MDDDVSPATGLIHHPYQPPGGFAGVAPPVYKASTVFFPDVAALRAYSARPRGDRGAYRYGLHGTPTTFALEARIASLEGGAQALLTPSGLAAIACVDSALLASGDQVLLPDNVYGPSLDLARHELARWGIAYRVYDPLQPESLAAALSPATRLVWLEAPGSVTLEFPDLRGLVARVRAQAPQACIALDNTWGAGLAFAPFDTGVDISVQALTKYPSGGGDVLMGSVVTRDADLYRRLAETHGRLGLGVAGNDAELLLRSLPSLPLRYAAHDAATRRLAQWCATQTAFVRVLHPARPDSPGHAHWASHCRAAAGLLTLELDPGLEAVADAFVDAMRLFKLGYSWGGPVSLVVPYAPAGLRRLAARYRGRLLRLSVGLEDVDDLIADLRQALVRVSASVR